MNLRSEDEVLNFGLWMQRQGFRHATCYCAVRALRRVARRTNILNPEAVKAFLAIVSWSESGRERVVNDLVRFYAYENIEPRFSRRLSSCCVCDRKRGGSSTLSRRLTGVCGVVGRVMLQALKRLQ
jgi:hypothetical protein